MNNERRNKLSAIVGELQDIQSRLEELRDEEREAYDNMPEGLQASEKGDLAGAVRNLTAAVAKIDYRV